MYFRCDRYVVVDGKADAFTAFFTRHVLPIQEKHGARLIGRWQTEDELEVLTIWAYESRQAAEEADRLVEQDRATAEARAFLERYLEPVYVEEAQLPLYSTVPLAQTALDGLSFR